MAELNLSLEAADELYRYAQDVVDGKIDVGAKRAAFVGLHEQLKQVCDVVPDWAPGGRDNVRIAGVGWAVSFKTQASDTGQPETALLDRDTGKTYMLDGDHREAYKAAAPGGMPALRAVFESLKDKFPHEY